MDWLAQEAAMALEGTPESVVAVAPLELAVLCFANSAFAVLILRW
jgi:hypothetical protein